jgi:hypothetical protein
MAEGMGFEPTVSSNMWYVYERTKAIRTFRGRC